MKICLIANVGGIDTDIVSHFFKYYKSIGIDDFIIFFHIHNENKQFKEEINYYLDNYNIVDYVISPNWYKSNFLELLFRKNKSKYDWIVRADQDEFLRIKHLSEFLDDKYDYYMSRFVDKVCVDGFPKIEVDSNLNILFPREQYVTRDILKACDCKITIAKNTVFVEPDAFHNFFCPSRKEFCFSCEDYKQYPEMLCLDHYKWNSNILKKMQERTDDSFVNKFVKKESDRFLQWFEKKSKFDKL